MNYRCNSEKDMTTEFIKAEKISPAIRIPRYYKVVQEHCKNDPYLSAMLCKVLKARGIYYKSLFESTDILSEIHSYKSLYSIYKEYWNEVYNISMKSFKHNHLFDFIDRYDGEFI